MVEEILLTTQKMVRDKSKAFTLTLFEKVTAVILFLAIVLLMFVTIHTRSSLDAVQQQVETIRLETRAILDDNVVLQQKIDRLTTSDRLEEIAKLYGLSRNEKNVRSVTR
ncbi:cell division protein FtsL [Carnobacteriaceae bacterium zg-ZUI252]|nr:cell division protein FtsL [Carnobacteriaceae bacterium zg-ZUI252]MBS4769781.1 cell division protein FtsL [Carnobacteriaceae bacterium zg-ZUI240]QTU82700.1 cell division protein FtsL [Carnobacteriaceae bacterium zg-C25]